MIYRAVMNLWFGEPWPRPDYRADVCRDDSRRIPVPVGEHCYLCSEPIGEHDRGQQSFGVGRFGKVIGPLHAHVECLLRNVTGCSDLYASGEPWSPGHVCSGRDDYRADALRVWDLFNRPRGIPERPVG